MSPTLSLLLAQIAAKVILGLMEKDDEKATPEVRNELIEWLGGLIK